jgi:hypothetical protein
LWTLALINTTKPVKAANSIANAPSGVSGTTNSGGKYTSIDFANVLENNDGTLKKEKIVWLVFVHDLAGGFCVFVYFS